MAEALLQLEKEFQRDWFSLVFYPVEGEALTAATARCEALRRSFAHFAALGALRTRRGCIAPLRSVRCDGVRALASRHHEPSLGGKFTGRTMVGAHSQRCGGSIHRRRVHLAPLSHPPGSYWGIQLSVLRPIYTTTCPLTVYTRRALS